MLLAVALLLPTCTQDFEEINTNENAPSAVQPELLLRQVIYGYADAMAYEEFVAGNLLSQHLAMIDFNLFDRHALSSPQEGGDPWPILYTSLRDNETILELARQNPAQSVYEGPALVMKAYLAMTLTDLFGDVPFFDAFRGRANGVTTPAYDAQEDIYLAEGGILNLLERAVAAIDEQTGVQPLRGDILFAGDLDNWARLANSLRIKALVRIADRVDPGGQIQEIFDGQRYLNAPVFDAVLPFAAGQPNNYPIANARIGIFNVFLMSATAADVYPADNPLTAIIYRPSASGGDFAGVANGIDAASAITPDEFARPGLIFRENAADFRHNYMTSWETDYLIAEAAARGFVEVDPQEWFDRAVIQSYRYWGTEAPRSIVNDFPDGDAVEQIITQKWMALAGRGYEAWTEWRRTGFPTALRPAEASLNGNLIPVRMPYPSDEQALNFENYRVAADATQDNSINVPVWWDVD